MGTPDNLVRDFLRRAGATQQSNDAERFWNRLQERHGEAALRFEQALETGGQEKWDLKNASLGLSLDVTMWDVGGVLESQLEMLADRVAILQSAATVVDVGCDNGLVTSFLAALVATADVRGIDVSGPAIDRARELAARERVPNADFLVADFREPSWDEPADVVVASRLLTADGTSAPGGQCFSIDQVVTPARDDSLVDNLRRFRRLGADDATFIFVERLPAQHSALRFVLAMAAADMFVDWSLSGFAVGQETDRLGSQPFLVASRSGDPPLADAVLDYWSRGCSQTEAISTEFAAEDVVEAFMTNVPLRDAHIGAEAAAEAYFLSRQRTAEWACGVQIEYDDTTARLELFRDQGQVLVWFTTGAGFRSCLVRPESELADAEESLRYLSETASDMALLVGRPTNDPW